MTYGNNNTYTQSKPVYSTNSKYTSKKSEELPRGICRRTCIMYGECSCKS